MAHQALQDREFCTGLQQVGCEAVTKRMDATALGNAGLGLCGMVDMRGAVTTHRPITGVSREQPEWRAAAAPILAQLH